ncbi:unnamed protein product [Owenia fusiformis]|uniref:Uncharacterized protein n=1 Tax=Owenia fusiformis TaxID=6347 RepID=A0A8S4P3S2_OWEFU|nr:unnamed protein product [Owenia fusiformis]
MDWSTIVALIVTTIASTMTLLLLYERQNHSNKQDTDYNTARSARERLSTYVLDDVREERMKWRSNLNDLKGTIVGVENAIQASNLEMVVVVDILNFYEKLLKGTQNVNAKLNTDLKSLFTSVRKMTDIVGDIKVNETRVLTNMNAQLRVINTYDQRNISFSSLAGLKNKLKSYRQMETMIGNVFIDVIDGLHKVFTCLSIKQARPNRTGEISTEEMSYISDISKSLQDLAIVLNVSVKAIKNV